MSEPSAREAAVTELWSAIRNGTQRANCEAAVQAIVAAARDAEPKPEMQGAPELDDSPNHLREPIAELRARGFERVNDPRGTGQDRAVVGEPVGVTDEMVARVAALFVNAGFTKPGRDGWISEPKVFARHVLETAFAPSVTTAPATPMACDNCGKPPHDGACIAPGGGVTDHPGAERCRHGYKVNGCELGHPGCICADERLAAELAPPEPAAPTDIQKPTVSEPDVLERLRGIARFLDGAEPDPVHGVWFLGTIPPGEKGPYWWRKFLRKWVEAVATEHAALRSENARLAAELEAEGNYIGAIGVIAGKRPGEHGVDESVTRLVKENARLAEREQATAREAWEESRGLGTFWPGAIHNFHTWWAARREEGK